MGFPTIVPTLVAVGVVIFAAIALGLWANDGVQKGIWTDGSLANCNGNVEVCVFVRSYPVAVAGTSAAILGAVSKEIQEKHLRLAPYSCAH